MAPGSVWPAVDERPHRGYVQVIERELIEGGQWFGAGTYLYFEPGSPHRPRTGRGERLFG
jgi:hypothetical protein